MSRSNREPPPHVLFSENALRRAWQLVRGNGPSPGSDGITLEAFAEGLDSELARLRDEILGKTYQPRPVRRYYVEKSSGKQRPLTLWAVRDRVAQRVIHDYLTPRLELQFLPCSYGFRPGRSTEHAIQAVLLAYDRNRRWVVDADIESCFDSIPIDLLMRQVRYLTSSKLVASLIEQWLLTPVIGHLGEVAGVSQGSVISPQLTNLYLHRFDQMMFSALPGIFLVRFADDFVVLTHRRDEAEWALQVAERCLANLQLKLNGQKTSVVHFQQGFEFLGMTFKGRRYKPKGDS